MIDAGINWRIEGFVFARGANYGNGRTRWRRAAGSQSNLDNVVRYEYTGSIIGRTGSRSAAEKKLMGRETGTLVGLEHIVRKTVLRRQIEVWIHDSRGIVDICKLWPGGASSAATINVCRAIHQAGSGGAKIAHRNKSAVIMIQIVAIGQRDGNRLSRAAG